MLLGSRPMAHGSRLTAQLSAHFTSEVTGLTVYRFSEQICVAGVASGFLDHVYEDPAQRPVLAVAGLYRLVVE